MREKIYDRIKNKIEGYQEGEIFFTSDFSEIASLVTIRKCLGRQVGEGTIKRIIDGAYEKPKFSKVLNDYIPPDPEKIAYAIARKYHWTISPCGDVALNKLGLSTQVPAVWTYISDGPYREYKWDNIIITFKHKTNRQISLMSEISTTVVEALRTLGKDSIEDETISALRRRLNSRDKELLLSETKDSASWIYEIIRKVCV